MKRLVSDLSDWIEIPSVTGEEGDYGDALTRKLSEAGFDVERQEVAPGRFNVLARAGSPEVVFCTHLDTVPPFFGVREDSEFIYGRGSCDAKGQAVSQIAAGVELLKRGEDRVEGGCRCHSRRGSHCAGPGQVAQRARSTDQLNMAKRRNRPARGLRRFDRLAGGSPKVVQYQ